MSVKKILFYVLSSAAVAITNTAEYATLYIGSGTNSLRGIPLHVGTRDLRARGDFSTGAVRMQDCDGNQTKNENFEFSTDSFSDPGRPLKYAFKTECVRDSTVTDSSDSVVVGMRTADSPLWKIWTYASFSKDEVRLGRLHPKNSATLDYFRTGKGGAIKCDGGHTEQMCLIRNVKLRGYPKQTFDIDFQSNSANVYVPQQFYLHYTSTSNCDGASTLSQWPEIRVFDDSEFSINAELLVGDSAREASVSGDDYDTCESLSNLLRSSAILVPHDDPRTIIVGMSILHDYTLDRDYIHSTMRMRAIHSRDHFSLLEMILFMCVFTLYIAHKTDSMERIGAFLVGEAPRCRACNEAYIRVCVNHVIRKMIFLHYASVAAAFSIAWYSIIAASRIGIGIDETELIVWSYVSLGLASVYYAAYVAVQLIYYRRRRTCTVADVQMWELQGAASVETACIVALFALTSVVRSDDLTSLLSFTIASIAVYDSLRRIVAEAILVTREIYTGLLSGWMILVRICVLFVSGTVGAAFTIYVMSRHVMYPTISSKTFVAIFISVFAYFAIMLNLAYMRRAMVNTLRSIRASKNT